MPSIVLMNFLTSSANSICCVAWACSLGGSDGAFGRFQGRTLIDFLGACRALLLLGLIGEEVVVASHGGHRDHNLVTFCLVRVAIFGSIFALLISNVFQLFSLMIIDVLLNYCRWLLRLWKFVFNALRRAYDGCFLRAPGPTHHLFGLWFSEVIVMREKGSNWVGK